MLQTAVREARATTLRIPVDRWLAAGTVASFLGLLLTDRVPPSIRRRIRERPEVFRKVATMSDAELDLLVRQ